MWLRTPFVQPSDKVGHLSFRFRCRDLRHSAVGESLPSCLFPCRSQPFSGTCAQGRSSLSTPSRPDWPTGLPRPCAAAARNSAARVALARHFSSLSQGFGPPSSVAAPAGKMVTVPSRRTSTRPAVTPAATAPLIRRVMSACFTRAGLLAIGRSPAQARVGRLWPPP